MQKKPLARRKAAHPVTTFLEREERDRIVASAKANERSVAGEVRKAIRYYLEHGQ